MSGPQASRVVILAAVVSIAPLLIAMDRDYDPITGMAPQTAIPVAVRPAPPG